MSEYHYQISEASRLLAVESHVLRYWEEELGMIIPRNEMGHRYYTEDHLRIFSQIKDMKERGYQLRAIRAILSGEEQPESLITEIPLKKESEKEKESVSEIQPVPRTDPQKDQPCVLEESSAEPPAVPDEKAESAESRMDQFQEIMARMMAQTLAYSSRRIAGEISRQIKMELVGDIRDMMKSSESRQEEQFRRLDESIRSIQQGNRARYEAAATRNRGIFRRRKRKKRYRRI